MQKGPRVVRNCSTIEEPVIGPWLQGRRSSPQSPSQPTSLAQAGVVLALPGATSGYPDGLEVEMPGQRKEKQIYHVNLMKRWYPPFSAMLAISLNEEEEAAATSEGNDPDLPDYACF